MSFYHIVLVLLAVVWALYLCWLCSVTTVSFLPVLALALAQGLCYYRIHIFLSFWSVSFLFTGVGALYVGLRSF